jgi:hypothetical protein
MLSANQVLKRIADKSAHKRPGTVSCDGRSLIAQSFAVARISWRSCLIHFYMLSRDPVDEAGEPGIPLYVCGDPDAAIR